MNQQLELITVGQGHMKRSGRLEQIAQLMESQPHGVKLTIKQISKFIGMKKSGHVAGIIAELCGDDGPLTWEWSTTVNGLKVRVFYAVSKSQTWAEQHYQYGEHEAYWNEVNNPGDF